MKEAAATITVMGHYSSLAKSLSISSLPSNMVQTIQIPIQMSNKKSSFI